MVVVTAIGRELVGFVWAIARAAEGKPAPQRETVPSPTAKATQRKKKPSPGRGGECPSAPKSGSRKYLLNPAKKYASAPPKRSPKI